MFGVNKSSEPPGCTRAATTAGLRAPASAGGRSKFMDCSGASIIVKLSGCQFFPVAADCLGYGADRGASNVGAWAAANAADGRDRRRVAPPT